MKKLLILITAVLLLSYFGNFGNPFVLADDADQNDRPVLSREDRPELSRDDRPVLDREQRIINPKFKSKLYPTTPTVGGVEEPTSTPEPSSEEDPCAPGKSYYGPYCGWSPDVDGEDGGDGGGGEERVGGSQVLGLSSTSSGDLANSDIILLSGVLCLLLYARSKLATRKAR